MRLLIADDHGIVRSGLRLLLDRQHDIEVVAEAGDGAEAVEAALAHRPDLCVLDVAMPKLTGLQATREIKAQMPDVDVLILSMHDDRRYRVEAHEAGARGYVVKTQADRDLLLAVRAVAEGESFGVIAPNGRSVRELSPRESEVLKLVAEAHTNRQIGEILHLSEKTVESHRASLLRKLGMRDRTELVRYAIRRGLVEP